MADESKQPAEEAKAAETSVARIAPSPEGVPARDETPVEIKLEVTRMYRANDSDTEAITVGPGTVKVPKWVAVAWGLMAERFVADSTKPDDSSSFDASLRGGDGKEASNKKK